MLVAGCWYRSKVAHKAIPTMEELGDVSSDVVGQHKLATRMASDKTTNVEYKLIKDNELSALVN